MGRIRLFPLLFRNGCFQSSRFPTAGQGERGSENEIDSIEIFWHFLPANFFMFISLITNNTVFLVQFGIALLFLKTSLVQINSKLNEKNRMITLYIIINLDRKFNLFQFLELPNKMHLHLDVNRHSRTA